MLLLLILLLLDSSMLKTHVIGAHISCCIEKKKFDNFGYVPMVKSSVKLTEKILFYHN